MEIRQQRRHLRFVKPPGKRRHHTPAREYYPTNLRVVRRHAAGQDLASEHAMQIGRDIFQGEIIFVVAMGAPYVVKMLPFQLLLCERLLLTAPRPSDQDPNSRTSQR